MRSMLRRVRIENELTLDYVSMATGIAVNTLSRFERGLQSPTPQNMKTLSRLFEVPALILFPNGPDVESRIKKEREFENAVIAEMDDDESGELLESPIRGNEREERRIFLRCARKYKVPIPDWYNLRENKNKT